MTKLHKTLVMLFLSYLIDGFARIWLYQFLGIKNLSLIDFVVAWIASLAMILFTGQLFIYYLLAFSVFEMVVDVALGRKLNTFLSTLIGASITGLITFVVSLSPFWTTRQLTIMGIVYPLLGGLYGYLYRRWISPITP